ncbi:hypothetical protein ACHAWF_018200 [Thalassiosira exigua]
MTIVAVADTRNARWADDANSFGRKMLAKMGWRGDGSGLGKDQQGTSTHLRAVRRADSLGIGAENDAQGERGWKETSAGFHGVLASLKEEYGSGSGSGGGGGEADDKAARKRRRKEEKKRLKREERRRAKNGGRSGGSGSGSGSGSDVGDEDGGGVRLPQNKVQAGHARKMREAKDLRSKSAADMAAIFGVKADVYSQLQAERVGSRENNRSDVAGDKKKKKSKKKSKEEKECAGESGGTRDKEKKEKKKRKRSSEGSDSDGRKKSKKDKSKK